MNRRSKKILGLVNFPVDDPQYENSNEGGMFVRLVVRPVRKQWMVCCGGMNSIMYDECFIGDDKSNDEGFHFPYLDVDDVTFKYNSIGYLCVITLGSTGWSGWDGNDYFRCKYENLTPEGKVVYDQIKDVFKDRGTLCIQTWLDT